MKRLVIVLLCCVAGALLSSGEGEIGVSGSIKFNKNIYAQQYKVTNLRRDQTGDTQDAGIAQILSTATNNLPINNVTDPHWVVIQNLDEGTNNVIRMTVTLELHPGDFAVFPVADTNMLTYSTNGAVNLYYQVNQK